jgi:hypothetical protein
MGSAVIGSSTVCLQNVLGKWSTLSACISECFWPRCIIVCFNTLDLIHCLALCLKYFYFFLSSCKGKRNLRVLLKGNWFHSLELCGNSHFPKSSVLRINLNSRFQDIKTNFLHWGILFLHLESFFIIIQFVICTYSSQMLKCHVP